MSGLRGKVVIVLGVDRGFGRDLALFAAEHGAMVVVIPCASSGATSRLANDIAFEIAEFGAEAAVASGSVCTSVGASRVVEAALDSFGRVDVLVNNASILVDQTNSHVPDDVRRAEVGSRQNAFDHVVHAVAPLFKKQQAGAFVHSLAPMGVSPRHLAFSAAKEQAVQLSRMITREMASYRVRSNCVFLSEDSATFETIRTPRGATNVLPFPRRSDLNRLARLSGFLASDAAEAITAQVFEVCGREISVFDDLLISDRASSESRDSKGLSRTSFLDANSTTTKSYFEAVAAWFKLCAVYPALADLCGA